MATPWTMWDLSSPTRDWTQAPSSGSLVLTIRPPGKSNFLISWSDLMWKLDLGPSSPLATCVSLASIDINFLIYKPGCYEEHVWPRVSVLCRLEKLFSIEGECSAESTGIWQFVHLHSSASNIYYVCKFRGSPGGPSSREPARQCRRHEAPAQPLGQECSLEESVATHSSILACRTPQTVGPGGTWCSMKFQRAGNDWSNLAHM